MVIFSRGSRAGNSSVCDQIWLNFELVQAFMIVLLTCKNEEVSIKNEGARVATRLYLDFSLSKADNSLVSDRIWLNFELVQAFMIVLLTCKNEEVSIKNEGARVATRLYLDFSLSKADNSLVSDRIWLNFENVQAFMIVLLTCKNEEVSIKNEGARVATRLYLDFSLSKADNSLVSDRIWLNFELVQAFMIVLLTCKNEEVSIKNEGARVATRLYLDFSLSKADNSLVSDRIWLNFELVQAFMIVLLTCKNEEVSNKNEGARVATRLYLDFSLSKADNSLVSDRIWLNFELVQAFMIVLLTCKNEEVSIKNEGARVATRLYLDFSFSKADNSLVNDRIWLNFELVQAFMIVLLTCKNEEVSIKNEGARVATRLYLDFSLSKADNSLVSDRIWFNFELVQAFMIVLLTCKNEEVSIKNEGARVATRLYLDFSLSKADNSLVSDRIWLNFELVQTFMIVLLTCKNEEVSIKNEGARVATRLYLDFSLSKADNSLVSDRIWLNFELVQAFMIVLLTCKNAEVSIKNEGARVATRLYLDFSLSKADNSLVSDRIWLNFELVQTFMIVLLTCKNEEVSIKNEGARVATRLYLDFSLSKADNSLASDRIWLNFELVQTFMIVLLTCKNEEVSIKNEGARVATRLYLDFSLSKADNSLVSDRIWLNFELVQAFMIVLLTCKNEEVSIKNEGARVATRLYLDFSLSKADNSLVSDRIWLNFELVQAFMIVLLTCKNEEVSIKNEGARVAIRLYLDYSLSKADNSLVSDRIWLNFELVQAFMIVLLTCKNEEVSIKNEGARVATRLYLDFSLSKADNSLVSDRIWLNFELVQAFMIVLLTCKNEEVSIKNEGARVATRLYLDFSLSKADNSLVSDRIWLNFELVQTFMIVLLTCKNEEVSIKNVGARVATRLYLDFSLSKADNSLVSDRIWLNFELVQAFMIVLLTCKNEEVSIKNEGARVATRLYLDFSLSKADNSLVSDRIWLNFELIQAFMIVLLTCKNEEVSIKNEGARVATRLYLDFSDSQGQITH